MKLEKVIEKYHKNGNKDIIVVPRYGESMLGHYQKPGNGFQITQYDKKSGLLELTSINNAGKKLTAYINVKDIAVLIDESDVWGKK